MPARRAKRTHLPRCCFSCVDLQAAVIFIGVLELVACCLEILHVGLVVPRWNLAKWEMEYEARSKTVLVRSREATDEGIPARKVGPGLSDVHTILNNNETGIKGDENMVFDGGGSSKEATISKGKIQQSPFVNITETKLKNHNSVAAIMVTEIREGPAASNSSDQSSRKRRQLGNSNAENKGSDETGGAYVSQMSDETPLTAISLSSAADIELLEMLPYVMPPAPPPIFVAPPLYSSRNDIDSDTISEWGDFFQHSLHDSVVPEEKAMPKPQPKPRHHFRFREKQPDKPDYLGMLMARNGKTSHAGRDGLALERAQARRYANKVVNATLDKQRAREAWEAAYAVFVRDRLRNSPSLSRDPHQSGPFKKPMNDQQMPSHTSKDDSISKTSTDVSKHNKVGRPLAGNIFDQRLHKRYHPLVRPVHNEDLMPRGSIVLTTNDHVTSNSPTENYDSSNSHDPKDETMKTETPVSVNREIIDEQVSRNKLATSDIHELKTVRDIINSDITITTVINETTSTTTLSSTTSTITTKPILKTSATVQPYGTTVTTSSNARILAKRSTITDTIPISNGSEDDAVATKSQDLAGEANEVITKYTGSTIQNTLENINANNINSSNISSNNRTFVSNADGKQQARNETTHSPKQTIFMSDTTTTNIIPNEQGNNSAALSSENSLLDNTLRDSIFDFSENRDEQAGSTIVTAEIKNDYIGVPSSSTMMPSVALDELQHTHKDTEITSVSQGQAHLVSMTTSKPNSASKEDRQNRVPNAEQLVGELLNQKPAKNQSNNSGSGPRKTSAEQAPSLNMQITFGFILHKLAQYIIAACFTCFGIPSILMLFFGIFTERPRLLIIHIILQCIVIVFLACMVGLCACALMYMPSSYDAGLEGSQQEQTRTSPGIRANRTTRAVPASKSYLNGATGKDRIMTDRNKRSVVSDESTSHSLVIPATIIGIYLGVSMIAFLLQSYFVIVFLRYYDWLSKWTIPLPAGIGYPVQIVGTFAPYGAASYGGAVYGGSDVVSQNGSADIEMDATNGSTSRSEKTGFPHSLDSSDLPTVAVISYKDEGTARREKRHFWRSSAPDIMTEDEVGETKPYFVPDVPVAGRRCSESNNLEGEVNQSYPKSEAGNRRRSIMGFGKKASEEEENTGGSMFDNDHYDSPVLQRSGSEINEPQFRNKASKLETHHTNRLGLNHNESVGGNHDKVLDSAISMEDIRLSEDDASFEYKPS